MSSCSGWQSPKGTWVTGTDQQRADCCRILRGTESEGTFITSQLEAPSLLQRFPELLPTGLAQLHPLRKSTHRGEALWAMKMIMDSDLEDRGGTKGRSNGKQARPVIYMVTHSRASPSLPGPLMLRRLGSTEHVCSYPSSLIMAINCPQFQSRGQNRRGREFRLILFLRSF